MTLIEMVTVSMKALNDSFGPNVTASRDEYARAAIDAVFDWQLTQSRDPVVLNSIAAMRKEALG